MKKQLKKKTAVKLNNADLKTVSAVKASAMGVKAKKS
jgi:hypothetical protein